MAHKLGITGGITFTGKTVVKDGTPAEVSISPLSVTHDEGDAGATNYTYTLSRVANPSLANTNLKGTVTYVVTGSGANPALASDFVGGVFPSGTVTFVPGDEEETLIIQVNGDTVYEPDEEFTVTLYAGENTTISPTAGSATGTLTDDDAELFNITISANTNNYNLKSAIDGMSYSGTAPAIVTVTINGGVIIGSTSTSTYAFDTGTGYFTGSIIDITNNGRIQGRGGNGGKGGNDNQAGSNGSNGGPALRLQYDTDITNNNEIWAGGGGGGGGGDSFGSGHHSTGGGGGRGAGTTLGTNGAGGTSSTGDGGSAGSGGSATGGGTGGTGGFWNSFSNGGEGGNGGGPGLDGVNGEAGEGSGATNRAGGTRGFKGNYITGNSFATWTATGDRRGGIA